MGCSSFGGHRLFDGRDLKATRPKEQLAENMEWVNDFSAGTVRLIGVLEILDAIGVVLPKLTGILPWLTSLAAVGLVLTMIGAAFTHLCRDENQMILINLVLLILAAFVAYGRFVLIPCPFFKQPGRAVPRCHRPGGSHQDYWLSRGDQE